MMTESMRERTRRLHESRQKEYETEIRSKVETFEETHWSRSVRRRQGGAA